MGYHLQNTWERQGIERILLEYKSSKTLLIHSYIIHNHYLIAIVTQKIVDYMPYHLKSNEVCRAYIEL